MSSVRAELVYSDPPYGERPYVFSYDRSAAEVAASDKKEQTNCKLVGVEVDVFNARATACTLDEHGFTMTLHTPSLTGMEFYDSDKVREVYYPEVEQLVKDTFGCGAVVAMHHAVRNQDLVGRKAEVKPYGIGIHNDVSSEFAKQTFAQFAPRMGQGFSKGRFVMVNVWRSIGSTPIQNHHLAMCDQRSLVSPDDFVLTDFHIRGMAFEVYRLRSNNAHLHKWYYYPQMKPDEVILFKQWDSDPTKQARICMHTAFEDPTAASDAPPRESIEVRCVCYFPDHTPNTCPDVAVSDDKIANAVETAFGAVKMLSVWPKAAHWWVKISLWRGAKGVKSVASALAQDKQGRMGFKDLSAEEKDQLTEQLIEQGLEDVLREHLPPTHLPITTLVRPLLLFGLGIAAAMLYPALTSSLASA
eukprot:m.24102 g.24102  ORF g.24102 m.24102 type:complete len:415 (-) comp8560_c0_seq2:91-1335(-)